MGETVGQSGDRVSMANSRTCGEVVMERAKGGTGEACSDGRRTLEAAGTKAARWGRGKDLRLGVALFPLEIEASNHH